MFVGLPDKRNPVLRLLRKRGGVSAAGRGCVAIKGGVVIKLGVCIDLFMFGRIRKPA